MPRTRRASWAGGVSAPFQQQSDSSTNPVQSGDLCVGCIVWLPAKEPDSPTFQCCKPNCCNKGLEEGGYAHPVVVLSIRQKENSIEYGDLMCQIALLTSFQSTSLATFLKKRKKKKSFQNAIPIIQKDELEETFDLSSITALYLEERNLNVQSYVTLGHTYMIPASMFRQYRKGPSHAYKWRLKKMSYEKLMSELSIDPEDFLDTKIVIRTKGTRLSTLAQRNSALYRARSLAIHGQPSQEIDQTRTTISQPHVVVPNQPPQADGRGWANMVQQRLVFAPVSRNHSTVPVPPTQSRPTTLSQPSVVPPSVPRQYSTEPVLSASSPANLSQVRREYSLVPRYNSVGTVSSAPSRPAQIPNYHTTSNMYGHTTNSRYNSPLPRYHEPSSDPPSENDVLSAVAWITGFLALGSFVWWLKRK